MFKYIIALFFMLFNVASEATHVNASLAVNVSGHVTSVVALEDRILIAWDGDNAIHCNSNTINFDTNSEAFLDRIFKIALTAQVTDEKISAVIIGCKGNFLDALLIRLCSDPSCSPVPGAAFN